MIKIAIHTINIATGHWKDIIVSPTVAELKPTIPISKMAFKFAVLFACLAYASAGYLEPATTYQAAPLAYSSHQLPALSYGYSAPIAQHTYATPIAHQTYAAPIQTYSAPIAHQTYAAPIAHTYAAAPALSYARSYAPALSYSSAPAVSYAHSYAPALSYSAPLASAKTLAIAQPALSYSAPLATTKTLAIAQPAAIAHSAPATLAYAPAHATSYTSSFMKYNSPLIAYAY
ncbi:cuticle protein 16.5-like [Aedes albopictus]|uniref:Cuticle protein n=1 Tax=Aedes albopictus TaxID=7160 RepID=A0ABM1XZG8_AEDAL|nr:cuticle protein 16.5-like [Aedes albopictus]